MANEEIGFSEEETVSYECRDAGARMTIWIGPCRHNRARDTRRMDKLIERAKLFESGVPEKPGSEDVGEARKETLEAINSLLGEMWSLRIQDTTGRRNLHLHLPRIDHAGNIFGLSPGRLQNLVGDIRILKAEYAAGGLGETQVKARLMEYVVGLSLAGTGERIRVGDVREISDVLYRVQVEMFYRDTQVQKEELAIADGLVQKAAEGTLVNIWDIFRVRESQETAAPEHRPRALGLSRLIAGILGNGGDNPSK